MKTITLRLWNGISIAIVFLCILFLTSCKTSSDTPAFRIPYHYPSGGIGSQPTHGSVPVRLGFEGAAASRGLVNALQQLQFSITNLPSSSDLQIQPGIEFITGSVPQAAAIVQDHNRINPLHPLPTDRHYALQFKGTYFLPRDQQAFEFTLHSKLWHRGEGGDWREYKKGDYSGKYFLDLLQAKLSNEFAQTNRLSP